MIDSLLSASSLAPESASRSFRRGLTGALLCLLTAFACGNAAADEQPLSKISFGSCAKQDQPQPIWDAIVAGQPQLFLFLGDNIYGDSPDMNVLKAKYDLLNNQPGYKKLKQICPVVATWDDHDYGKDDAGAEFTMRRESQQVFLDFLGADQNDPRRTREGVYSSQVYGPEGKRVQILMLDARYFRSPLKKGFDSREPGEGYRGRYVPNTDDDATVLGEAQWKWLAEQLQVPAEIRVIGSSYQVLSDQHGWEMWGNFPKERQRLFQLLRDSKAGGVVMVSGDRHLAELAALPKDDALNVGYPLFEVTSSSLNAPSGGFTKAGVRFSNEINPYRVGLTFFDVNYGNIVIDWQSEDPVIRLQVCDQAGMVVLQQRAFLSELQSAE
jgi:alkaline phosphatase D